MSNESKSSEPGRQAGFVLVTGAARRIGKAITREVHSRGCSVIIHYLGSEERAHQLQDELNGIRANSAFLVRADLTDDQGPQDLASQVAAITDRLSLLVNNASRFYPTDVADAQPDTWKDLMGSNLRGPYFLTQALLPLLAGGSVINITDIHAERPMPGYSIYCMAKAGLQMMTRSLAVELAPDIRVNAVAPGAILWPEHGSSQPDQAAILQQVALGRTGQPEDIARAVAYLGLEADYVTGQVLAVDGGRSLNI